MKPLFFLLLVFLIVFGCKSDDPLGPIPNDGWETQSLHEAGIDTTLINNMLWQIDNGNYVNVDGIVLVKGAKLVFEKYYNDYTAHDTHNLYSAGKSIISIYAGLAVDRELLDVNESVAFYFPEYRPFLKDDALKEKILLKHLMTMTSGLDCGSILNPDSNCREMFNYSDPIGFMLDLAVVHEPGTHFNYNDGAPNVIKKIIERTTVRTLERLTNEVLYPYLDIPKRNNAMTLTPRDLAKLGALYLNDGVWKGVQLISSEWIQESTSNRVTASNTGNQYGYYWWRRNFQVYGQQISSYYAAGNGGQYIFVVPELDLVAVFTGSNFNSNLTQQPVYMMARFVLPAVFRESRP